MKPEFKDSAVETFLDMEVEIVEGSRVLGSVIGSENACRTHLDRVALEQTTLLRKLANHAKVSRKMSTKCLEEVFLMLLIASC